MPFSSMILRIILIPAFMLLGVHVGAADPGFAGNIRPVLSDACYNCHGPDAAARKAKLRLDDRTTAMHSGVLKDGELLKRLTSDDPEVRMPPPDSNRVLKPEDRAKLVEWVKNGAAWPEDDRHWAFVPPGAPAVPQAKKSKWPVNGIDRFVLAKLEKEGLQPSPRAGKVTLLRRLTLDLTGLPPTIGELDSFLGDECPGCLREGGGPLAGIFTLR